MAIYMLTAKIIGRSAGGNAVAAAAYRSGEALEGERWVFRPDESEPQQDAAQGVHAVAAAAYRAGEKLDARQSRAQAQKGTWEQVPTTFDYTRKEAVVESFIITPEGAPDWTRDRATLWQTVEQSEKRKDSQLARELIVSLPRELTLRANAELVRDFVTRELVSRGMIADVSIHNPMASDGKSNPHAHILLTMRDINQGGFGFDKKRRDWNAAFGNTKGQGSKGGVTASEGLQSLRERWADALNGKLVEAGSTERVSHLSNEAQGIDRKPQPKMGKHWHGRTQLSPLLMAERGAVQYRNAKRAYMRPSAVAARKQSAAMSVEDFYELDNELRQGLYQNAPPELAGWQHTGKLQEVEQHREEWER